jgi:hypothetical protein
MAVFLASCMSVLACLPGWTPPAAAVTPATWDEWARVVNATVVGQGCTNGDEFARVQVGWPKKRVYRSITTRHYIWPEHVYPGSRVHIQSNKPCGDTVKGSTADFEFDFVKRAGVWRMDSKKVIWNW